MGGGHKGDAHPPEGGVNSWDNSLLESKLRGQAGPSIRHQLRQDHEMKLVDGPLESP